MGSLYQYFPNRDALTAAMIERETAGPLTMVPAAHRLLPCETTVSLNNGK
jgi:AcrR family transcriptional regulator